MRKILLSLSVILVSCGQDIKDNQSEIANIKNESLVINTERDDSDTSVPGIRNFHLVENDIYRSGLLTANNVEKLSKEFKVKTILSVDSYTFNGDAKEEEERAAKKFNVKYIHIPMSPLGSLDTEKVKKALEVLKTAEKPLVVHCKAGEDRTGIVVGSYRLLVNKWEWNKTYSEMLHYGFKQKMYRKWADALQKMTRAN